MFDIIHVCLKRFDLILFLYLVHYTGDKIPRDETLIFEVELIGAYPHYQAGMPNMFARMDKDKDGIVSWQEVSLTRKTRAWFY